MTHRVGLAGFAVACAVATGALLWALPMATAEASSHREAPLITEMPKVDGTDWYGGPNFFFMDPDALYEIHIDNTGDGKEDLAFQFRFKNTLKDLTVPSGSKTISVPLINIGPISGPTPQTLNISETYTLDIVRGGRASP